MKRIQLDTEKIHDWTSFHQEFKETLGFPESYGANMDAWIDCMSYLDDPISGMSKIIIEPGELLLFEVLRTNEFRRRCPGQFGKLVECTAIVNQRYHESGTSPPLALMFL